MNYSIVFSSVTKNTESIAREIRNILSKETCVYFGGPSSEAILNTDVIFVGFWTDKGTCDEKVSNFLKSLHQQKIILFGTAGFGGSKEYFEKILERVSSNLSNSNQLIGQYMCQGKMPFSVKIRYENILKTEPNNKQVQEMLANYESAVSHPDEQDFQKLKNFVNTVIKILN